MTKKGEHDMQKMLIPNKERIKTNVPKHTVNELVKDKKPIVVKNGVAQITPSHPDYKFWMED